MDKAKAGRGRLKVFLGMCPGVGKTYAMLEAARREARAGREVVIGYLETHGRAETEVLAAGLPEIPRRSVDHRGITRWELDLDGVLSRRPGLVLVDELAHSNPPGARHPKRWQDIEELLDAGIAVFTTLNVQHVESRVDTVREITGIEVREVVPDRVLDGAVLELVDLPPAELLKRLEEGRVYLPERAAAAMANFFREANLTALREMALRLVADHVGDDTAVFRRAQEAGAPWKTGNRLMVAVGPSPHSGPLIRWTRRMADELQCRWYAVHVEAPEPLSGAAEDRLHRNLETARQLGAEVVVTAGGDLVPALLRVAHEKNVTQIIFGKPGGRGWLASWQSGRVLRRLLAETGDIDLHIVRAERGAADAAGWRGARVRISGLGQYLVAAGAVGLAGALNVVLSESAGPRLPGLVFLVVLVLLALVVGRGPVFLAGTLSALIWNFFFLPPRFTWRIGEVEDLVLFGTYFLVAVVLGQFVARIRVQAEAERQREKRSTALYQLTRDLAEAWSLDEVVWNLVMQVERVFGAPCTVNLLRQGVLVPHPDGTFSQTEKELGVSDWALKQRKPAGRLTDTLPGAEALHLPLTTERRDFGVLAVKLPGVTLSPDQRDLLETFARQAALVLDRVDLRAAHAEARLVAESERLGRTLLNSISHELRTPLAASISAASALADAENQDRAQRQALIHEIQEANARLNRIVGNLLDATRLESGQVRPRFDWQEVGDLVSSSLREVGEALGGRAVRTRIAGGPLLVRVDAVLLRHALTNLLLNIATHTPKGTPVEVTAGLAAGELVMTVADQGPGIPPEVMPRIFEKFYRGPGAPTGGSGLGLTIARGFLEAQGGTLEAENRPGGGALFKVRIAQRHEAPAEEGVGS